MAELYATLVIVSITLSMSYVVYSELSRPRTADHATFFNRTSVIAGSPGLLLLEVNSSRPTVLISVQVDNVSSSTGILALGSTGYSNSQSPCGSGLVSFFSVQTQVSTEVRIQSDGEAWISGYWRSSSPISPGWTEVMISNASSCTISAPGGSVSALPVMAANETNYFRLFLPAAAGTHTVLLVFGGGFDKIAFSA